MHAEAGEFKARLQRVRGPVLAVGVGVGSGDLSENLEDDLVGEEVEGVRLAGVGDFDIFGFGVDSF